jgi:hypothetical protein
MAAPRARAVSPDDERDAMISTLTRVVGRLALEVAPKGNGGALTFRAAATRLLRIASDEEVDVLEKWMTEHP